MEIALSNYDFPNDLTKKKKCVASKMVWVTWTRVEERSSLSTGKGKIWEKHSGSPFMNLCLVGRNRHSFLKMEEKKKNPGPICNQEQCSKKPLNLLRRIQKCLSFKKESLSILILVSQITNYYQGVIFQKRHTCIWLTYQKGMEH